MAVNSVTVLFRLSSRAIVFSRPGNSGRLFRLRSSG
jgi:hypothetical protein